MVHGQGHHTTGRLSPYHPKRMTRAKSLTGREGHSILMSSITSTEVVMSDRSGRARRVRGVHAWLALWRATRTMEGQARHSVEAAGLCLSDFAVLEALLHKGPLSVGELGRRVLLTSGSITTSIDRLERDGLVERMPASDDRRSRIVHLTEIGRRPHPRSVRGPRAGHGPRLRGPVTRPRPGSSSPSSPSSVPPRTSASPDHPPAPRRPACSSASSASAT